MAHSKLDEIFWLIIMTLWEPKSNAIVLTPRPLSYAVFQHKCPSVLMTVQKGRSLGCIIHMYIASKEHVSACAGMRMTFSTYALQPKWLLKGEAPRTGHHYARVMDQPKPGRGAVE